VGRPGRDDECVRFLQWALPRLRLRWEGFRKPRRQVCRRVRRRAAALGVSGLDAYRDHLLAHPDEWALLDGLCVVTISRFYRDRGLFALLAREILPELRRRAAAEGRQTIDAWSAGCASGEEPYTLLLLAEPRELDLRVLGTDLDERVLRRAERACYPPRSLKALPASRRNAAFVERGEELCLRDEYRRRLTLLRHDVRHGIPDGPFDLVLCRNLAFTYFEPELQLAVGRAIAESLRPAGALVIGAHESLPAGLARLEPWPAGKGVYRAIRPRAGSRPGRG
jgi:chemotaxis protein methyltransferase CheR